MKKMKRDLLRYYSHVDIKLTPGKVPKTSKKISMKNFEKIMKKI